MALHVMLRAVERYLLYRQSNVADRGDEDAVALRTLTPFGVEFNHEFVTPNNRTACGRSVQNHAFKDGGSERVVTPEEVRVTGSIGLPDCPDCCVRLDHFLEKGLSSLDLTHISARAAHALVSSNIKVGLQQLNGYALCGQEVVNLPIGERCIYIADVQFGTLTKPPSCPACSVRLDALMEKGVELA